MSKLQRREFLAAAGLTAAAAAALASPRAAEAGDPSFMNNVPDPLLAGEELPTFKFELEKSEGKVDRRQRGQRGHGQAAADLQGDRRRFDDAGPGRHARAPLARHRGRVGVRGQGASPDDGPRPGGVRGDE